MCEELADELGGELFDKLDEYAENICATMDTQPSAVIRPYACRNKHEFFSVAVENFFERPRELRGEHPHVFEMLRAILRQDPINAV